MTPVPGGTYGRVAGRDRCAACDARLPPASVSCGQCGHPVERDLDATSTLPWTISPEDLITTHRSDRLRAQLSLGPGESALVLTRGAGAGSSFRLTDDVVSLGRSSTATIILDDISVSRRHAEVRPAPHGYRIFDVGSLNGTYLNDRRVDEAALVHGDEVQIGLFKLVFLHMDSQPT